MRGELALKSKEVKKSALLNELRGLSYKELSQRLQEVSRGLMNIRLRKRLGEFNVAQYRNLKKERARILTIMRQKKLEMISSQ